MWLNKIILRVLHSLAGSFKERQPDFYVSVLLECFDPEYYKSFNDNKGSLKLMVLIYPNIMQYIEKLVYCNTMMIEGLPIPRDWNKYDYRNSNLSSFLKDNKNREIEVVKFVTEFKLRVSIFLEEYDKSLKDENLTRNYNARVLSEFRSHLLSVVDVLIRSSIY